MRMTRDDNRELSLSDVGLISASLSLFQKHVETYFAYGIMNRRMQVRSGWMDLTQIVILAMTTGTVLTSLVGNQQLLQPISAVLASIGLILHLITQRYPARLKRLDEAERTAYLNRERAKELAMELLHGSVTHEQRRLRLRQLQESRSEAAADCIPPDDVYARAIAEVAIQDNPMISHDDRVLLDQAKEWSELHGARIDSIRQRLLGRSDLDSESETDNQNISE